MATKSELLKSIQQNTKKLVDIVFGDEDSYVETSNGNVPTLRRTLKEIETTPRPSPYKIVYQGGPSATDTNVSIFPLTRNDVAPNSTYCSVANNAITINKAGLYKIEITCVAQGLSAHSSADNDFSELCVRNRVGFTNTCVSQYVYYYNTDLISFTTSSYNALAQNNIITYTPQAPRNLHTWNFSNTARESVLTLIYLGDS